MSCAPAVRKPSWLKIRPAGGPDYNRLKHLLRRSGLHTVCEEAQCPNVHECWAGGTATIMLGGDVCTRGCRFCAVKTGVPATPPDPLEPAHTAEAVASLGLEYLVITMVNRDDLPDGAAGHVAATIRAIRAATPALLLETLVSDFMGRRESVDVVVAAAPDVFAHNIEVVERLTPRVRDHRASYRQSLQVLEWAKSAAPGRLTKSSIMLGLGETEDEVLQSMRDLRSVGVNALTLGQYLQPSSWHAPVEQFVTPEKFDEWRRVGENLGFDYVASGPLVRSSYRAGEYFLKRLIRPGLPGGRSGGGEV
ncbi:MAG: lipoyl synthase [Planctomycetes bacterium]|nr:lipoyl synthase [Planctomycetota bacterium]